ncbi:hypothetical protein [Roseibium polysiphoniae]|uniref:Uncharacterized protein n=1 Tax=Roseibium polysiphoniae TaxID=2571221 RepID=A0A927Q533_9HYPH|nr:hypothetical protein [Roseibium polysiphoniae]MBD8876290.1 hypothetical protein [Roseibium polysiphoniae]MBS8260347.1 hypothetical protein [Roseibium polysiphoniae]
MMSIGSAPPPPQQTMQSQLTAQVEAGEITSEDSDAMLAALEAIHDDMAPEGGPSSTPPSKEEMQEKMEGLLSDQVDAGTLTQEQADELSAMFESGEMGPPPPPPPGGEASGSDSSSEDLVALLLEELTSSTSSYSESGDSTSSATSSLLVDYLA